MTRSILFLAALAATAATVAIPAYAAEAGNRAEVRYGDLDLTSADGAQALKSRVVRAAKRVCAVNGDPTLEARRAERACTDTTLARAMPQVELALANAGTQVADNSRMSVSAH